ncbi:hypothetical protein CER18_07010 [Bartonella tribocorum]|uniref:Uncharacterized protein n=1 Tax=Bartonella tribocorum TaxID=85701 RepID=A0A2M6UQD7_9HYPH|nr:hypothetical protein CER18_07010 [Bartonella tribocorum]
MLKPKKDFLKQALDKNILSLLTSNVFRLQLLFSFFSLLQYQLVKHFKCNSKGKKYYPFNMLKNI